MDAQSSSHSSIDKIENASDSASRVVLETAREYDNGVEECLMAGPENKIAEEFRQELSRIEAVLVISVGLETPC